MAEPKISDLEEQQPKIVDLDEEHQETDSDVIHQKLSYAIQNNNKELASATLKEVSGAESFIDIYLVEQHFPDLAEECCKAIDNAVKGSRSKEICSFSMEIFTDDRVNWKNKLRSLGPLKDALLKIKTDNQMAFICNAIIVIRKKCMTECDLPLEVKLHAMADFGAAFVEYLAHPEAEVMGLIALEDALNGYLFHCLTLVLPLIGPYPSVKLDESLAKGGCLYSTVHEIIDCIGRLARNFLNQPPIVAMVENHNKVSEKGEGEIPPLGQAAFLYLTEVLGMGSSFSRVSRILHPQRRFLCMAWAVHILLQNNYLNVAYSLMVNQMIPVLPFVSQPILEVKFYSNILDGFGGDSDQLEPLEDLRINLFTEFQKILQTVPYRRRLAFYSQIIKACKIDKIAGAVVTLARTEWWNEVEQFDIDKENPGARYALTYQACQIIDVSIGNNITISDGAETYIAGLNFLRLLLTSEKCAFCYPELLGKQVTGYLREPVPILLDELSQKIDIERKIRVDQIKDLDMVAHLCSVVRDMIPKAKEILDAKEGQVPGKQETCLPDNVQVSIMD